MNANGELLLTKCSEHGLTITNTLFMHNDKFKGTWQHPRSKHWHQLDHVIVRQRDLKEVLDTKSPEWTSKHKIRARPQDLRNSYKGTDTDSDDPEHIWINIRDAIQSECEKSLGETVRCNKDWFRDKAEEIESALERKRKAHTGLMNNPECRQAQKHFATAKHEAQKNNQGSQKFLVEKQS
ncbi:uncharacterized protein LOC115885920 [Sitophilus oryzae]|uniref:Uncharacterized protein LOC115885920 n=1 Tax=Sitophilus oryzae TaxID=7048 RepID=A0A6J2YBH2_SITOR|nr:uncharacterized protein LOC115885920 [Sitophilus oryzae]